MEKPLYAAFLALFYMGTGQMTQKQPILVSMVIFYIKKLPKI